MTTRTRSSSESRRKSDSQFAAVCRCTLLRPLIMDSEVATSTGSSMRWSKGAMHASLSASKSSYFLQEIWCASDTCCCFDGENAVESLR